MIAFSRCTTEVLIFHLPYQRRQESGSLETIQAPASRVVVDDVYQDGAISFVPVCFCYSSADDRQQLASGPRFVTLAISREGPRVRQYWEKVER